METIYATCADKQMIVRLTDSLLDLDIVVDDCRQEVDAAVERLRTAVQRRTAVEERLRLAIEQIEPAA